MRPEKGSSSSMPPMPIGGMPLISIRCENRLPVIMPDHLVKYGVSLKFPTCYVFSQDSHASTGLTRVFRQPHHRLSRGAPSFGWIPSNYVVLCTLPGWSSRVGCQCFNRGFFIVVVYTFLYASWLPISVHNHITIAIVMRHCCHHSASLLPSPIVHHC